jgi:hypothetical protein
MNFLYTCMYFFIITLFTHIYQVAYGIFIIFAFFELSLIYKFKGNICKFTDYMKKTAILLEIPFFF